MSNGTRNKLSMKSLEDSSANAMNVVGRPNEQDERQPIQMEQSSH